MQTLLFIRLARFQPRSDFLFAQGQSRPRQLERKRIMRSKANQVPHQNEANDTPKIAPTGTSPPTGANPASTEPPCVSNQNENRLVEQSSPIDPVPPTSHKQESVMNKKTEIVPTEAHL